MANYLKTDKESLKILKLEADAGSDNTTIQKKILEERGIKYSIGAISRMREKFISNFKNIQIEVPLGDIELDVPLTMPPPLLKGPAKAEWFRQQFKTTHMFKTLHDQFTSAEIQIYLHEYGNLCCQFEDIVFSEFFQIDDFLKHRILINRELTSQKRFQKDLETLTLWFNTHSMDDDVPPEQKKQHTKEYMLRLNQKQETYENIKLSTARYDKLVQERSKIFENLAATRRDRLDELKGGKETFFSLVNLLQHSEQERELQGKFAELTKLSSEYHKKKMREPTTFPDGEQGQILLDAESVENLDE